MVLWCYTSCNRMPTQKHRINISVPDDVQRSLEALAVRDEKPVATMTLDLLQRAIELEEDRILQSVAESRETESQKFVSHDDAWK